MRPEVVERRQAALARLLELRSADRLSTDTVEAAAAALGVQKRTVWRWLTAGEYQPGAKLGWRVTTTAIEAFYRTVGDRRLPGGYCATRVSECRRTPRFAAR